MAADDHEYTWHISEPKSDLDIKFNVWNFIAKV